MRFVKITTIFCSLILIIIPVIGATSTDSDSKMHTYCRGKAFGEIVDYRLSYIEQLIFLLIGKPISLLITRGTVVIKQEPDMISLELIDPIKRCCWPYYGNITIYFYASIAKMNFNPDESHNCTYSICSGFFGIIQLKQN